MTLELFRPRSVAEACNLLAENEGAKVLAGGTDILAGRERGSSFPPVLISLDGLGLEGVAEESSGILRVGPLTTHTIIARSAFFRSHFPVLAEACASVGSPQVRNRGSLGGNLGNASPAADTAAALIVLGASVEISGLRGKRMVPVEEFFLGPGRTVLERTDIISGILLPFPAPCSAYRKLGRRKAMEIAVVGVAVALVINQELITECRIGLTAVAPTPLRAHRAEAALRGRTFTSRAVEAAAQAAADECSPVDDHRASARYRREMVKVLLRRAVESAAKNANLLLTAAITGEEKRRPLSASVGTDSRLPTRITLRVNGQSYSLEVPPAKLLIDVLREDLGLTGAKKGCGEGECGTCTVHLDGLPVNACLVLAATVGDREVKTVEGLARGRGLHPLQSSFVRQGAVQCGYCTPGMLMSGSALLQTNPHPEEQEIKEALSGNLCRCTGYKKIIQAVRAAGKELASRE